MTSGSDSGGFFEGWYYKLVSAGGRTVVLIPGVLHGAEESFGFVMLVDPDCKVVLKSSHYRSLVVVLNSFGGFSIYGPTTGLGRRI